MNTTSPAPTVEQETQHQHGQPPRLLHYAATTDPDGTEYALCGGRLKPLQNTSLGTTGHTCPACAAEHLAWFGGVQG